MKSDEKKLWDLYKKTKRHELLEKIVEKYLYMVHYQANKLLIYSSPGLEKDELYSAGVMGLLEAIERFDPDQGFEFKTFASKRIRGSIVDEIRRVDWIPRSIRKKSKLINSAINNLFNKNNRMPTDDEIAEEMEITLEDFYKITDNLGPMFLSSLNVNIKTSGNDENLHLSDIIEDKQLQSPEEEIQKERLRNNIIEAIGQLSDKEKLVISLYYYEELTLKEIGLVMNVSESRICQIHSSALIKLQHILKESLFNTYYL